MRGYRNAAERGKLAPLFGAILGWLVLALVSAKIAHAITGQRQPWVYIPFALIGLAVFGYGYARGAQVEDDERSG